MCRWIQIGTFSVSSWLLVKAKGRAERWELLKINIEAAVCCVTCDVKSLKSTFLASSRLDSVKDSYKKERCKKKTECCFFKSQSDCFMGGQDCGGWGGGGGGAGVTSKHYRDLGPFTTMISRYHNYLANLFYAHKPQTVTLFGRTC